jgi:CubicO group peptidase (beta-lactamase class C family)
MATPRANIILDTNDRIAFGVYADIFRASEGVLVYKLFIGFRHHTTVSQGITDPEDDHRRRKTITGAGRHSTPNAGQWWVWDALTSPGSIYFTSFQGAYEAVGSGGQYITVLPAKDMVIVHEVDIDKDYRANISPEEWDAILNMVVASACHGSCS